MRAMGDLPLLGSLAAVAALTAIASAVRSVSRIWLRHWADRHLRGSQAAALYLERPQRLLLAATTGIALTVFLAGTVIAAASPAGAWPTVRALVSYAVALLLVGQLLPRAIGRRWPGVVIPVLLPVLRGVEFALMPLLVAVRWVTGEARREAVEVRATEIESLDTLLREGELEGIGERGEIAIIEGVVHFGEKTLGAVMTPRAEVFAVLADRPPAEVARAVVASRYSRVPVVRGTLDDVLGILHAFDLLDAPAGRLPALRPALVASPQTPCNEFLGRMIRARSHMAIVRDDAGATVGVVTLEDLLEELVGDIRDEHDEPPAGSDPPPATPGTA